MTEVDLKRPSPRGAVRPTRSLTISVRSGTGTGSTPLSAFDSALRAAGVANRNLVYLSSVIPAGSDIRADIEPTEAMGAWGDRLYVVRAECRVEVHNEEAWAGLGWVTEEATGRGLMVEHEGHSRAQVDADIESSLDELAARRPGFAEQSRDRLVCGITCESDPVCALVVAAFHSEPWIETEIDLR